MDISDKSYKKAGILLSIESFGKPFGVDLELINTRFFVEKNEAPRLIWELIKTNDLVVVTTYPMVYTYEIVKNGIGSMWFALGDKYDIEKYEFVDSNEHLEVLTDDMFE